MRVFAVVLGILALAVPAACPAMAQATTATLQERVPIVDVVANPCTGEPVVVTDTLQVLLHETVDASGALHITDLMGTSDVSGVAVPSGTSYTGHASTLQKLNLSATAASDVTVEGTFTLVSQGSAQNFRVDQITHLTANANGTLTATVDRTTATCLGPGV